MMPLLARGQVWEWTLVGHINEVYLLLRHVEGLTSYWSVNGAAEMWEALNLETGQIEFVTPEQTAGEWLLLE